MRNEEENEHEKERKRRICAPIYVLTIMSTISYA